MTSKQNAHLTHKGNVGVGRHGWLRLTPAYSVSLVREIVSATPEHAVVTDPFSGTGTTALAAAEHGRTGQAVDINPFLIWLGNAKLRTYGDPVITQAQRALNDVVANARQLIGNPQLWQPDLFKIERWWTESTLSALKALRAAIDLVVDEPVRDLMNVTFCRTLIAVSNAAFNHQSMSFKPAETGARFFEVEEAALTIAHFQREAVAIIGSAALDLAGRGSVSLGDSRSLEASRLAPCDLLLTSPPYVNRMSYIRELRPYMYWMRDLKTAEAAGALDWLAIGGTWGSATSKLNSWLQQETTPVDDVMGPICAAIATTGVKNGPLLANYVRKYFDDMWGHFQSAYKIVRSGGAATYIIGNSMFYGNVVPAEQCYAVMLREASFENVTVAPIRKRNSKKALYEYAVSAVRP